MFYVKFILSYILPVQNTVSEKLGMVLKVSVDDACITIT